MLRLAIDVRRKHSLHVHLLKPLDCLELVFGVHFHIDGAILYRNLPHRHSSQHPATVCDHHV